MYPGFAKTARDEGFADIAEWFETLAKAEKSHAGRFEKARERARLSRRGGAGRELAELSTAPRRASRGRGDAEAPCGTPAAWQSSRRRMASSTETLNPRSDRVFFTFNAVLSSTAVAFIAFILMREGTARDTRTLDFLPPVNAVFNGLSATCLVLGYVAIRKRAVHLHRLCMVSAFALSALFLVGYLTYHSIHGDTKFTGTGPIRAVYFFVLISHIALSLTVVPLALTSFYLAFKRSFVRHRKLNRVFLPIWLYVSVTGVVIYLMLRANS